jgi:hypothetical protein
VQRLGHAPHGIRDAYARHYFGFPDFRRALTPHNAPYLSPEALQKLMQHRSFKTTMGYITLANQVNQAAERCVVPMVLKAIGKAEAS